VDRTIVHRAPFDADTQAPTDIIMPMTVLAASDRVDVVGPDTIDGRDAEVVSLSYEDATPLFAYLQFLGSWRPFYPQDRVLLWLDASTWFPLRYEVFPAPGAERRLWAAQMGVSGDPAGHAVFTATARALATAIPPSSMFAVQTTAGAFDEGFGDGSVAGIPRTMRPQLLFGLAPVRFGRFTTSAVRTYGELVAAYAGGLAWTTVTRIIGWDRRHLFGVGDFAERVALGFGRGIGYYEPATSTLPRRIAIHTDSGELLVATDLSRGRLVRIAGSLPVVGRFAPSSWLTRRWSGGVVRSGLTVTQAVQHASFGVLVPASLPAGYRAAAAQTVETPELHAVTLVYRRPAAELDGVGIRLYETDRATLPPPQSVSEEAVAVGDAVGRWSPDAHLLEWISRGVYVSLSSPAFDLSAMLAVAQSLHPVAP
jgi:hypothetical protein